MMTDALLAYFSNTAMVLAAGFGTRMRPLTLEKPKPLFEVGGRTMLDRAIDHLQAAGIARVVVNAHYLGDQIKAHVAARSTLDNPSLQDAESAVAIQSYQNQPLSCSDSGLLHCARNEGTFILSSEAEILDTGGGVKNALAHFGDKPFFVMSADLPWTNGAVPALERMAQAWDEARMDVLLLLCPRERAKGFHGAGDFMCEPDGRTWRKGAAAEKPYVWLSVMIVKPALYYEISETVFSNNVIFNRAEDQGRLFGLIHDGTCFHVGTPEDLAEANRLCQTGVGWG